MLLRLLRRTAFFPLVGFCIVVLAHHIWFFSDSTLTSGDWNVTHPSQYLDWSTGPKLWSSQNFGAVNVFFSNSPVELWLRFLSYAFNFGIAQRVVYFIPTVVFSYWGVYLLCRDRKINNTAATIGGIVYLCATPLIITRTGHNTLAMAYALAPIFLFFYQKFLDSLRLRWILPAALLGVLIVGYELRGYFLLIYIVGLFSGIKVILDHRTLRKMHILKYVQGLGVLLFLSIVTSLYWILPLFSSGAVSDNAVLGRPLFGASFASVGRSLTLSHAFWTGDEYIPFAIQPIQTHLFIPSLFLLISIFLLRKNPLFLPYSLLFIVGVFLAKQENFPFGFVYELLYAHFPTFSAFREASKFYFFVALSGAVLTAGGADYLIRQAGSHLLTHRTTIKNILQRGTVTAVVSLVVFANILNLLPLATGRIRTLFVPRKIPAEYVRLNRLFSDTHDSSHILWVPTKSRWAAPSDSSPPVSFADIHDQFRIPYEYKHGPQGYFSYANQVIKSNNFKDFLQESNVGYVVVPAKDVENDDDFYIHYGGSPKEYRNLLATIPSLRPIKGDTGDVFIFENTMKNDRVEALSGGKLTHRFRDSTRLDLRLDTTGKSATDELVILFRENYHPGWGLAYTNENDHSFLSPLRYTPIPTRHQMTEDGWNEFRIPIDLLKRNTFSIVFFPQQMTVIGYIVSAAACLTLVITIIVLTLKGGFRGHRCRCDYDGTSV